MPPRSIVAIALLLLVTSGLALLCLKTPRSPASVTNSAAGSTPPGPPRIRERPPSARPGDHLRSLTGTPVIAAPVFGTVERWAVDLTDSELRELLEETGMDEHAGLAGWRRCALYAEWGRRDPEAALRHIGRDWFAADSRDYARAQAAYSVFRGWASIDPEAALRSLDSFLPKPDDSLRRHGFELDGRTYDLCRSAIFRELAKRDPEHAWRTASGPLVETDGLHDFGTISGLFGGIDDAGGLRHLLDRWTASVWDDPATRDEIERYAKWLGSSFTGFVKMPESERILRAASLTYAGHDLRAAIEWLRDMPRSDSESRLGRTYELVRDWARNHPDDALDAIANGRHPDHTRTLAIGLLAAEPARGPEVMALLPDERARIDLAREFPIALGSHHVEDFFPAPWKHNRLRDFEADYRAVLDTVAAADLTAADEASLLQRIHREFASHVPAAAERAGNH